MVASHLSISRFSDKFEQLLRRKNHVTPKNFLDYINIYRKVHFIIIKKKEIIFEGLIIFLAPERE